MDIADYERGVEELKFSLVGRVTIQSGETIPTTFDLKKKLEDVLKMIDFKEVPYGWGVYYLLLYSMEDQVLVMSQGPIHTYLGVIEFTRWFPGFNPQCHKQTTSQAWIRIHDLPLEYRKEKKLLNITMGVGLLLKVDPQTLNLDQALYVRVLVNVDCARPLPKKTLVTMKNLEKKINIIFFSIFYEKLPKYYQICNVIGHEQLDYRK